MKRAITLITFMGFALQLLSCGPKADQQSTPKKPGTAKLATDREVSFVEDEDLNGLKMVLREAGPPRERAVSARNVEGEPLSDAALKKLLARAQGIDLEESDRVDFAKRKGSKPAPRTGKTINESFPPKAVKPAPESGEPGLLEVLRFAPEGDVDLAPHLSMTFSKPMVAVTSQEEASKTVSAKLSPVPDGEWRWLGTRTLLFKPQVRFPMATDYQVSVPAGTKSANGDTAKEETRFSFSTPAPGIEDRYPVRGPFDLSPVIFIEFDQRIDQQAMAEYVHLQHGKDKTSLRPASEEEIEADDVVRNRAKHAEEGRWLALVADEPLPKGTSFKVVVKKGAPSAEGPKRTPGKQRFEFFTYDPLKIVRHWCGWRDNCPPTAEWRIKFNNPIDEKELDPQKIQVEPSLPGKRIQVHGNTITIDGLKRGRTKYTVTVPADLKDKFGQPLGEAEHITFDVGPAEATLIGPGKSIVTVDPSGPPEVLVHATNHKSLKVKIHRVTPSDWPKWSKWKERYHYDTDKPGPMPGRKVFSGNIKVKGENDQLTPVSIDFKKYLKGGYGQFLVLVEPTVQPKDHWRRQMVLFWAQVTDIGLTAFTDYKEMLAWVTKLEDGSAIQGAKVSLFPEEAVKGTSDEKGLARMELTDNSEDSKILVAKAGKDTAVLPPSDSYWYGSGGWSANNLHDSMRWYTFDDRGMYRPGETARVKGWMRKIKDGIDGGVQALPKSKYDVSWVLRGPRGNELLKGETETSTLGGFDLELELPKDVNLGTAWLELSVPESGLYGATHSHGIKIQEFRRPEFEVKAEAEAGPYILGEEAIVTLEAAYYAGGGLPNADVRWWVRAEQSNYTPPNRDDYQFGAWSPWWRHFSGSHMGGTESLEGKTDPAGKHFLGIHFEALNPARPMTVHAEGTVTDVNRQGWTAKKDILVHPSAFYLGMKTDRGFVGKGDPVKVEHLVVDIDGEMIAGVDTDISMVRLDSSWKGGEWVEEELDEVKCDGVSTEEPGTCTFEPKRGGSYLIKGAIKDPLGRKNTTEIRVWVSGGERPPARDVEMEELTLVPEKEEYQPGEKATFLLQAPFYPADGVLSIRRGGLVREESFHMDGPTREMTVPITEKDYPQVTVQIDLVGSAERSDDKGKLRRISPRRVAFASGALTFKVPPLERTLNVTASPKKKKLSPGGKTTIDLKVSKKDGSPVKDAEIMVVVADESVLALSSHKVPDPIGVFYSPKGPGVSDYHQRKQVVLSDPAALASMMEQGMALGNMAVQSAMPLAAPAPMGGSGYGRGGGGLAMDSAAMPEESAGEMERMEEAPALRMKVAKKRKNGGSSPKPAIAVRTNFDALALFAPEVRTNSKGMASVEIDLPDSLTRYRVMVVAVSGGRHFGMGESSITARLPLMVRPSAPRFLNFGDRFELPIVLQNQTDETMSVEVGLRATNISLAPTLAKAKPGKGTGKLVSAGKRVEIPANDRVEVRFPGAAQMAGKARFQVVAASSEGSDAANFDLPVWTPATSEAFATYGEIDKGAVIQPVRAPGEVWEQFGGLEITTSSTQLQALTDAVLYLVKYPFDCNEQIASRILAVASLRDVLTAFEVEGMPTAKELEKSVKVDLKKLSVRQNHNGGFSFWRRGDRDWPYLTVHVASAMARAKAKGYDVPKPMWNRSVRYLKQIESHIPSWYSKESRWSIRAYAINILGHMGEPQPQKALGLLKEAGLEDLPMEALGWILPVLNDGKKNKEVAKILRHLTNKVTETAAGAHFVTGYSDGAHVLLHSDRRVDGIILESLIQVKPKSDLVPKLVRGLLAHRKRGKWSNTQENAFVLIALDKYFHEYEKITPNFFARVWLGDVFAGERQFKGRSTDRSLIEVPMSFVAERKGDQPLTIQKDGKGRLYYRVGMRYAPKSLELKPADYGFAVERSYEAVDDDGDVSRDEDGTWRIKAGARVRVNLTMVAPMRRYHVALVDPLPAGLEPINPELAVSGSVPENTSKDSKKSKRRYWWWWRPWYEHQNMRDERVEAFTSLLWDGVHEYTYVARATTPGIFVVPPTKAEEMYNPETFGRTGTDRVIVE